MEAELKMRIVGANKGPHGILMYRFVRPNGAGGRWRFTEYLAWVEWRRWSRTA